MRLRTLAWFYGRRLRVHWPQEALAALGISTGVALLFAVQVANSSITASAEQMMRGITGSASLQLAARDQRGFDASVLDAVRATPGVKHATPLLQERANLLHGRRSVPVEIVGVDPSIRDLGGVATRSVLLGGLMLTPGIVLPSGVSDALGLPGLTRSGATPTVTLAMRGRSSRVRVVGSFGPGTIGPLANAMMAVTHLPIAQRLAGLPGRVTRILVVPHPGREAPVRRALELLAGDGITVAPVTAEIATLEQATAPNDQATGLFAAISGFVGLLFAFNAMLLTLPERRRSIVELRVHGYQPHELALMVVFQALLLGMVASGVGLLVGDLLSRVAAQEPPSYLSFAFPLGTHRVVPLSAVLLAWGGGVAMTCVAAIVPLLDLRRAARDGTADVTTAEPGEGLTRRTRTRLAATGLMLVVATTILLVAVPAATIVGIAALAATTVLVVPAVFSLTLRVVDLPARHLRLNALVLAVRALRATTLRSLALAATGAVAVFGSVAIEGAHRDLIRGLEQNFADYLASADVWITTGGDENSLTTQAFPKRDIETRLRAIPAVGGVRTLHGGFLDIGDHRVWVIGRPAGDRAPIPPSQLEAGDLADATARLRAGGWAAVSDVVARHEGVGLGGRLTLPTASGERTYRIAAILTNLGWGPGAVILNADDFRAAWRTDDPAAFEIDVRDGHSPLAARGAIDAALTSGGALRAQTTAEREAQFNDLAKQGLARLSQISTLLLIAAALAIAAAVGAAIWQRRIALARLRIDGYEPAWLWRTVMLETGIVLGVGCLTGVVAGTYGHMLLSRWLQLTTGFPAPFSIGIAPLIATVALVAAAALAVTAVPGYLASRTPARAGLHD